MMCMTEFCGVFSAGLWESGVFKFEDNRSGHTSDDGLEFFHVLPKGSQPPH